MKKVLGFALVIAGSGAVAAGVYMIVEWADDGRLMFAGQVFSASLWLLSACSSQPPDGR